jgi:hypothetical protein
MRWARGVATCAAACAATLGGPMGSPLAATMPDHVVTGACRDGAPNGAYELRMPDGRLRILGAFAKGRRTGTFLFWAASGARIAVIPYDDDAKVGTIALWYLPRTPQGAPRRKLEAPYAAGAPHGITRSWHPNGERRAEYRYEHGNLVAASVWAQTGAPLAEPEARRIAERDRATDTEFYASLERTIAENAPRCD